MTSAVNLLPWRERQRARRRQAFFASLAGTFAAAVALVVLAGWRIDAQTSRERQRGDALASEAAAFETRIAAQETLLGERNELAARTAALQALAAERPLLAATLDELARSAVAGVHYTAIVGRDGRVTATGIGAGNGHVAELMRRLTRSEWFSEQALEHIAAVDAGYGDGAAAFELAFRTSPPMPVPPPAPAR